MQLLNVMRIVLAAVMTISLISCNRLKQDTLIVPPSSPPLTRSVIGYGVLTHSYTHVLDQPRQGAVSLGYIREGTVVPVLERRSAEDNNKIESWVLVKGVYEGWLKEEYIVVYENEAQAKTAAESLN